MAKTKLEDVFKTGGIPTITFVPPVEYTSLLIALRTPGRGVVIEGPSGIGKTTAVIKALEQLEIDKSVTRLSARKSGDLNLIKALPEMRDMGIVLVDDFHKLEDGVKALIADFIKVMADEEREDSKIVVLGINKAGESLVKFAHDLNNRLEVIAFEANPRELVDELIRLGEAALNLELNIRDSIVDEACGSFYLAQMLAHECCLEGGYLESQDKFLKTEVSFELVKGKVFQRLARTFMERTQRFARGPRFRPEGRAPYLHLLYWLGTSDSWVLACSKAARDHPALRGSLTQIMEKGYLSELINSDPDLSSLLHFDSNTQFLTVEDPQYVYFLRNIAWSRFASDVGFISTDFPSRYDFALSFAGEDRFLAQSLYEMLVEAEFEVFYDKNEQHRILAQDVEDYLRPIYQADAQYVVVFLGPEYPKKIWTKFESDAFRERFGDGAVIPIWFSTAPPGIFDESTRVGGMTLDTKTTGVYEQLERIAKTLGKKMKETRAVGGT